MTALPPKTISGIQEREDERVIPMTRRPDGTFRKERKVRPGYTPPEDVAKYTNRVLESVRPTPAPTAPATAAANSTPKSKTQLKNDKRKAKRKEEAVAAELAGYPAATNNIAPKSTTATDSTAASTTEPAGNAAATTGPVDPEKKLRALNKKLRQVEQLKERQAKGETMLPEQIEKIDKMDDLLAQIAELSL
ncbi:hypothetical protein BGZ97_004207 [Linnemannia gamsii]|uniref:WIBG Mago-binding domain-containing protein n=1 Tax=Linnemannia gamsii TaxID=64522 RepID=A0A9P6QW49_9FUNG|nr:hypothetical protein BGZ97_004207 [Linnemannia gamsii]